MEATAAAASDTNNNNNNDHSPVVTSSPLFLQHSIFPPNVPPYFLSDQPFVPNVDLKEILTSKQGFSEMAAKKALYWTGNQNVGPALEWLGKRSPSTYETPLEDEIRQVRSEIDQSNQEMLMKMNSPDPHQTSPTVNVGEMFSYESSEEKFELVLVLNSAMRMKNFTRLKYLEDATRNMIYNLSLTSVGNSQLRSWRKTDQEVEVGWAENSQHLTDLQLCGQSLCVESEVSGLLWDRERLHYKDQLALALWGRPADVDMTAGNLLLHF